MHPRTAEAGLRHPIRALLIAPLIAPPAYWIGVTAGAWSRGLQVNPSQAFRELAVITAFGLPIAYFVTLVWGAPVLYLLHRLHWLRATTVVLAAVAGGILVGLFFGAQQQTSLIRVRMPLSGAALIGALVGGTYWWVGRAGEKPVRR